MIWPFKCSHNFTVMEWVKIESGLIARSASCLKCGSTWLISKYSEKNSKWEFKTQKQMLKEIENERT